MRNPYDILGVQKTASAAEIKKVFRKLAKNSPSDRNADDPTAKDRFAEVNSAYEILGDADKRGQFDRGEIDADGKPRFQGFEGFGPGAGRQEDFASGFNFSTGGPFGRRSNRGADMGDDVFSQLFGDSFRQAGASGRRGRPQKGEDIAATLTVTLEEIAGEAKKRRTLPTGRDVDVVIPKGVSDGQVIRLRGQGNENMGRAGDLLLTVTIAQHPVFTIDGQDLRADLPVTLYEAVLGAKVRVPTLNGAVELSVPKNTSSGRTFRLRGKGMPAKKDAAAGDLFVTLRIALPDGNDADLEELMQRWRETKPYNPRGV